MSFRKCFGILQWRESSCPTQEISRLNALPSINNADNICCLFVYELTSSPLAKFIALLCSLSVIKPFGLQIKLNMSCPISIDHMRPCLENRSWRQLGGRFPLSPPSRCAATIYEGKN